MCLYQEPDLQVLQIRLDRLENKSHNDILWGFLLLSAVCLLDTEL